MRNYTVLVTGSRDLADFQPVWEELDRLLNKGVPLLIMEGGCETGADFYARKWVQLAQRSGMSPAVAEIAARDFVPVGGITIPAYWKLYGNLAGPKRNAYMTWFQPNLVLAFFQDGAENRGTSDCVRSAQRAGLTVRQIQVPLPQQPSPEPVG